MKRKGCHGDWEHPGIAHIPQLVVSEKDDSGNDMKNNGITGQWQFD